MDVSIQDLKEAKQKLQDAFNLSAADAARVVGYINSRNADIIQDILSGDLSGVPSVLSALEIKSGSKPAKKNTRQQKTDTKPAAALSVGGSVSLSDKIPADYIKPVTSQNNADIIPAIDGDIVPADDLPAGFADTVREWFESWAAFEKIDLLKLHAQQWRAACMYIGTKVKDSHVLYDKQWIKTHGGRGYSGTRLEALLTLWGYFCGKYKQVPLVSDFVSFTGVSRSYFYDYEGRGLSSTSVQILKKAREMEENGLGSSVAGGGAGTVGGIFLLKTRHGYSETVTIQHTSSAAAVGVGDLPLLTDKKL